MTVRKIRAKLVSQLRAEGLSGRASQGMSRTSIVAVLETADATETSWEGPRPSPRIHPDRLRRTAGENVGVFAA